MCLLCRHGLAAFLSIAVWEHNALLVLFQRPWGRMLGQHGFLAHVFSVFNKFAASVDVIATSEVTVSLTLDEGQWGCTKQKAVKRSSATKSTIDRASVGNDWFTIHYIPWLYHPLRFTPSGVNCMPGYKHVDVPAIERELQEVAKVPWEHVCANTSQGQERLRKGSRRFQMEFRWNSDGFHIPLNRAWSSFPT